MSRSDSAADSSRPLGDGELPALFESFVPFSSMVLAVSGGPDSIALLHLVARWRNGRRSGPALLAVTVDHGLRKEAAAEAAAVAKFCKTLSIPHEVLRWRGRKPASGLQAAARDARYRLLFEFAGKHRAGAVATAHTRDDQAETVLLRLVSGSGIGGLGAMQSRVERDGIALLRPLLGIQKSRLVATLEKRGIAFARDPSNDDPRFTRVRLRRLMVLLEAEGLSEARLLRLAKRAARAEDALDTLAVASAACVALEGDATAFGSRDFFELPAELGIRMLRTAIDAAGKEGPSELAKVEALFAALSIAHRAKAPLRRTLAGALVSLSSAALRVAAAPPRKSSAGKGLAKRRTK